MSSIESMVLEIEENYEQILKDFKEKVSPTERAMYGFRVLSEQDILDLLRKVMNFQRKVEFSKESILKLCQKAGYTKRLEKIGGQLLERLCDGKTIFGKIMFHTMFGDMSYDVTGVIPLLKWTHEKFFEDSYECRRFGYRAYHGFKLLKPSLIEFEEELRLISSLTTYPIEKKIVLKNQLVANDFDAVAVSLEEAESNVESEHFKDCVSRCRDAVEIFIASIREKETGEKTERRFAVDFGKIVKIGVFDVATRTLAQGVYSFLSIKGSHKYDAEKVTIYDAETSLKETYSIIEILLKKLYDYKKSKGK